MARYWIELLKCFFINVAIYDNNEYKVLFDLCMLVHIREHKTFFLYINISWKMQNETIISWLT